MAKGTRDRRWWWRRGVTAVAVALAVTGAAALVVGLLSQTASPPAPAASAGTATAEAASPAPVEPVPTAGKPGPASPREPDSPQADGGSGDAAIELGWSRPVSVEVPAIGVRSSLVDLGLDADGVMETPEPVDKAGWFTPSPPPGVPGATVIAGHVTWNQRPSVFFRLGALELGDEVRVRRADGATVLFGVTRVDTFAKSAFPTEAVYDQPDSPQLRLITCGGEYDEEANRYLDNVVVWAEATAVREAAS